MSQLKKPIRVLLVEDNPGDALLMRGMLETAYPGAYQAAHAETLQQAQAMLDDQTDAVLLDLSLPDSHGLDTITKFSKAAPHLPIVVLTGVTDENVAMEAVRRGAQDYLVKGQSGPHDVARVIRYAIDRKHAQVMLERVNDNLDGMVRERTAQLQKLNQTLQLFSSCNQAIVRIRDEKKLLDELCHMILNIGGYSMAWVGFARDDRQKTVVPAAAVGGENGYLSRVKVTWADAELGRGPTGTCIREGRVVVGGNFAVDPELAPWREEALKRGYQSSIALPLSSDGRVFGALTIYAAQPSAFDNAQAGILKELAADLAYGIVGLRTQTALHESQQRLKTVVQSAPVVIWALDTKGFFTLAEGMLKLLDLTAEKVTGKHMVEVFGDRPDILGHVQQAATGHMVAAEVELRGLVFESRYSPLRNGDGNVRGVLCVSTDITEQKRMLREIAEATERVQRRIGQDLHDSIQGSLTGISFSLAAMKAAVENPSARPSEIAGDIDKIGTVVQQTIEQTRGLAKVLCPPDLKGDGLKTALKRLADITGSLFRLDCRFDCKADVSLENEHVATHLYYIIQEALNNSLKHARAEKIVIRLERRGDEVRAAVEDDGIGIPVDSCPAGGMGIRTMNHRAKMIGALLDVRRAEASGTVVECRVPLQTVAAWT